MSRQNQALALTTEQQAIVTSPIQHQIVRAVAGSGKTTTLAYRIRHLLASGIEAKRLLVLMFNKSAQLDFSKKLLGVLDPAQPAPEVRTFHAMAYRLYHRFVQEGALPPFKDKILSERESQFQLLLLSQQILTEAELKEFKRNKKEHLDMAGNFIEQVKSQLRPASEFFLLAGLEDKFRYFIPLFERFEAWRKQQQRISYSDMLYDPVMAMLAKPELQALVRNKMALILVDEYQDTNDIQHQLLKIIAGERAKITIIGDPDQTIYEFRGAKPSYMVKGFAEEFPDTVTNQLSVSFRYGHHIALLANHLIANSPYANETLCLAHEDNPHTKVTVQTTAEASTSVVQALSRSPKGITAVLLRLWSQSVSIELALLKAGMPYQLQGHAGVFGSQSMRAVFTLLKIASGEFAQLSQEQRRQQLYDLCQFPHLGLNEQALGQFCLGLSQHGSKWGYAALQAIPSNCHRIQSLKLQRFARALSAIENNSNDMKRLLNGYVEETKLYEEILNMGLSQDAAQEKLNAARSLIEFICKLPGDAQQALATLHTMQQQRSNNPHANAIITTIHRAKGLEWDNVIIPNLDNNTYPNRITGKALTLDDIASERRLLYVAMTRAKQQLLILVPHNKDKHSRYLSELCTEQSKRLSQAIYQNEACHLTETASNVCKAYARRHDCQLNEAITVHDDVFDAAPWNKEKVHHTLLGEGRVLKEHGDTFSVQFLNDKSVRTFVKKDATKHFAAA